MGRYEKALFYAFVWPQAVERITRDLVLEYADHGRLSLSEKEYAGLEDFGYTLGWLIKKLKPCIKDNPDLYNRLKELNSMRNDVVHRSGYMDRVVLGLVRTPGADEADITRFQELAGRAQATYDDLLHLFREEMQQ